MTTSPSAMTPDCLLIVNPRSGTADKGPVISMARNMLAAAGISTEVALTRHPGHATELAADAVRRGIRSVIAAGGDGTVNETARALCHTPVAMGILPVGSGNGLARHLRIPLAPEDALRLIISGSTLRCDCGSVNGTPFFCTFGIGYDAAVSYRFASRPGKRGFLNYIRSAAEEFVRYRPQTYTITTAETGVRTSEAFLIACCNASQYGNNAYIAPMASVTDGLLDIAVMLPAGPLGLLHDGIDLMSGHLRQGKRMHYIHTTGALIERTLPGPVHLDGDPAIMGTRLKVECLPAALTVYSAGQWTKKK